MLLHRSKSQGPADGSTAAGRHSVTSLVAVFAGGNLVAMVLRTVGGALIARLVEPATLGRFQGIGLVLGYLPFLQLGVLNGLNRELPLHMGKGQRDRAYSFAATAQAWALMLGTLATAGMLLVGIWHASRHSWESAAGWAAYAVDAFFLFYSTYYLTITYRTHSDFRRLSMINVATSILSVVFISAVWRFGYYGLCVRTALLGTAAFLALWRWRPVRVRARIVSQDFIHLLQIGFPIFAVGQLQAWWPVLNQTLVLRALGSHGLGLFALSNVIYPSLMLFPNALCQITYPRTTERFGRDGDVQGLIRYFFRPTALSVLVMVPLILLMWGGLPFLTRLLLPKYAEGVPAAQWSLLLALLAAFSPINNVFVVLKKQRLYALATLIGMGINLLAFLSFSRNTLDLVDFVKALVIGKTGFTIACYVLIWRLWKEVNQVKLGDARYSHRLR